MNQRTLSVAIAIVSLLGVGAVSWWSFQKRTSPGPLASAHERVVKLRGNKGCDECHGQSTMSSSMEASCVKCHELIQDQISRKRGIHGTLAPGSAAACEMCHHEHLGDTVALVPEAAFKAAGIADITKYDHSHAGGWELTGKHSAIACKECHKKSEASSLQEGERRFLGLNQTCTSCHEDIHRGELGAGCAECHGQEQPFKSAPLFQHPKTFELTQGHAKRACSECHTTPKVFKGLAISCESCHMKSYDATTKPAHAVAKLGKDCATCHNTASWEKAKYTHPETFALIGAHTSTACAACHEKGEKQKQVDGFAANRTCAMCHTSPHDVRLLEASRSETTTDVCTVCHKPQDIRWDQGVERTTPALHAATGFALAPPHEKQECSQCHVGMKKSGIAAIQSEPRHSVDTWKAMFPGRTEQACEKCHKDPHNGQFEKSASRGECLACHDARAFVPNRFDTSMHSKCSFPLEGNHRAVACSECHKVKDKVRGFVGTPQACSECHQDVHNGNFDKAGMPRNVEGRQDCARCHNTTDFQKVSWTAADHQVWTGEALTGKHATASCDACHRRAEDGTATAKKFTNAAKACISCHGDIHGGQFRQNDATDCARCHTSTESFSVIAFDHQKDSTFALDVDHAKLACAACHKAVEAGATRIVRYKPLGTACIDCHDPRSQKARGQGASR